ncbi:hypothetical protein [Streptomyces scopuliridis]|uniref:hypothetical protein n=1 Tax=Streptomyces scopuliridis TaxID=452529 RepID=UPI0036B1226E
MKVRMKITMSGTRNGEEWPPKGAAVDLPTGEAQHLVAAGIAEEVPDEAPEPQTPATPPETPERDEAPEVETAAAPPKGAEKAVAPAAKRGRPRKE